jgi:hypothetical protein
VFAIVYLAAYGARTPLLALRGLLRLRNAATILVPAALMGAVALVLQGHVLAEVSDGAIALAIVPAPLVAPGVISRMRGRADLAGALVLGTVLVSLLIVGSRGSLAAGALFTATEAYALAAMFGNAVPTVRDLALLPLRVIGWVAFAFVLLDGALAGPLIEEQTVAAAVLLLIAGTVGAGAVARITGRDVRSAIAGAGLRDPALAVAIATITAGPGSTGVALVYAAFCLVLAGIALRFQ